MNTLKLTLGVVILATTTTLVDLTYAAVIVGSVATDPSTIATSTVTSTAVSSTTASPVAVDPTLATLAIGPVMYSAATPKSTGVGLSNQNIVTGTAVSKGAHVSGSSFSSSTGSSNTQTTATTSAAKPYAATTKIASISHLSSINSTNLTTATAASGNSAAHGVAKAIATSTAQ